MRPKNIAFSPIARPTVSSRKILSHEERIKLAVKAERMPLGCKIGIFIGVASMFYMALMVI